MAKSIQDKYNELQKTLREAGLMRSLVNYQQIDWAALSSFYFRKKGLNPQTEKQQEQSKIEAERALSAFAQNFNYKMLEGLTAQGHEYIGYQLANFLYAYHLNEVENARLTPKEGLIRLQAMAKDLMHMMSWDNEKEYARTRGRAAFYEQLNMNRMVERFFDTEKEITVTQKDGKKTKEYVPYKKSIYGAESSRAQTHESLQNYYSGVFESLFNQYETDESRANRLALSLEGKYDGKDNKKQLSGLRYNDFPTILEILEQEPPVHPQINFARGRFYRAIYFLLHNKNTSYRQVLGYLERKLPNPRHRALFSIIAATPPSSDNSPSGYLKYYNQVRDQLRSPEEKQAEDADKHSAVAITFRFIGHFWTRAVCWVKGKKYYTQHRDWASIKHDARFYIKANFSYDGLRAQGPGLFWGLIATIAVLAVFGGLITYGILPLTFILFTMPFPSWVLWTVPLSVIPGAIVSATTKSTAGGILAGLATLGMFIGLGATNFLPGAVWGIGVGITTMVSVAITVLAGISTKFANWFYGHEIDNAIENELELDDLVQNMNDCRKDLVLIENEPVDEPAPEMEELDNKKEEEEDLLKDNVHPDDQKAIPLQQL